MKANQRQLAGGLIFLLAFLTGLDAMTIDMYLPGMPGIALDLKVSSARIQHTLSIFLLGLAIGQGLYGPLLDRYGRRTPLLVGMSIFVAGSILGALAPSVEWLLAARFVQAIGAAAGLVAPRAIVSDRCSLAESARIFSLLMQVMTIIPIIAPVLGGYLLGHGGWRFIFWVLAGLGAMGLLWSFLIVPDSLPPERRVPLQLAQIGRAYGRQIGNRVFMAYTLAGGISLGAMFVYISGSAFVFTGFFGLTPTQFSYLFAANSVSLILGGTLSNRLLSGGLTAQRVILIGLVLHTLAGLSLLLAVRLGAVNLYLYAGLLSLALGTLGLVFGNLTALTMEHAGAQAGTASALMGMLHYLVSAIVGYLVILAAQGLEQMPLAIAVCGALALLLCHLANRAALDGQPA